MISKTHAAVAITAACIASTYLMLNKPSAKKSAPVEQKSQEPRTFKVKSISPEGVHNIACYEWGNPSTKKIVFLAHGLTRNARDFDPLAEKLRDRFRVIAYDFAGRGLSDRFANNQHYNYVQYQQDALAVINAALAGQTGCHIYWVGTSMGGLLGMCLASLKGNVIEKLVLNDIGPEVSCDAFKGIQAYISKRFSFDTLDEAAAYMKSVYGHPGAMGECPEWFWRHLGQHGFLYSEQTKKLEAHHDVEGIADGLRYFTEHDRGMDLWELWKKIDIPMLALRGKNSPLLTEDVKKKMLETKPSLKVEEYDGVGHVPAFLGKDADAVLEFLLQ